MDAVTIFGTVLIILGYQKDSLLAPWQRRRAPSWNLPRAALPRFNLTLSVPGL